MPVRFVFGAQGMKTAPASDGREKPGNEVSGRPGAEVAWAGWLCPGGERGRAMSGQSGPGRRGCRGDAARQGHGPPGRDGGARQAGPEPAGRPPGRGDRSQRFFGRISLLAIFIRAVIDCG